MFPRSALLIGLTLGLPGSAFELREDSQGDVVRWGDRVDFVLDAQLSIQLHDAHADAAVKAAVETIAKATPACAVSVRMGVHRAVGYVAGQPNQNDIFVMEDWPYDEQALAATVITINARTNEIIDADIVFNADDHRFRVVDRLNGDTAADLDDVQNTLTHELGHALGLMHNTHNKDVVMYPSAAPFETSKRVLAADDREGLGALYEAVALPDSAQLLAAGCSSASPGSSALALLLGASLLLFRRRLAVVAALAPVAVLAADPGTREVPDLAAADRVAVADVSQRTSLRLPGSPGLIVTDLKLTLRTCVKGDCATTFTVRLPGGRLGDLEQVVAHQPVPAVHEAVLLVQRSTPVQPGVARATVLRLVDPVQHQRVLRAFHKAQLLAPVSIATHVSPAPPGGVSQPRAVAP
jgi:uncharacterized protein (TIGR03382 family)